MKNKKEKDEKSKQPQKSAEASIVDSELDSDVLCVSTCVSTTNNRCAIKQVLDSSCTYHMCPHRDWFPTYKPLDLGVVLMGNDAQCNVVGTGTF